MRLAQLPVEQVFFPSLLADLSKKSVHDQIGEDSCWDGEHGAAGHHNQDGIKAHLADAIQAVHDSLFLDHREDALDFFPGQAAWNEKIADLPGQEILRRKGEGITDDIGSDDAGKGVDAKEQGESQDENIVERQGWGDTDGASDGRTQGKGTV